MEKRTGLSQQSYSEALKKLVKRGITELVTPGVSINENVLNYKENNFLAAVHFGKGACGVSFLDISTGEFLTATRIIELVGGAVRVTLSPKRIAIAMQRQGYEQRRMDAHRSVEE